MKPIGDYITVRFIDSGEDDEPESSRMGAQVQTQEDDPILAVVVQLGTTVKTKGFKKGDTVLLRPWVSGSQELEDGLRIVDSYAVMAVMD